MNDLLYFLSLSDPSVRWVVLGSVLLTGSSAIVGTFTFLRKRALIGDAVAHAVLPGVCLAFMLAGRKDPFLLMAGALATGWLSLFVVDLIKRKTKLKEDTAIGLVLSVFFGVGIFMLTEIQHSGNASQSGLDHFLFGKAASLVQEDVTLFGAVAVLLVVVVYLLYKEFTLLAFDENFARSIGFPVRVLEFVLTSLSVFAIVIGIQAVGLVLMAAMLITPAAAARFWTNKLSTMLFLATLFGVVSGISGAYISWLEPSMPTGPWIVMVVSVLAVSSFFFAPSRGIVSRMLRQYSHKRKILEENILKELYHLGEHDQDFMKERSVEEILHHRPMHKADLTKGLSYLKRGGYVEKKQGKWMLNDAGLLQGKRVTRLHRLWEMYLTEYLRIAPDHVHDDAETMEHILTPEIEERLQQLLNKPEKDPHDAKIPY